MEETFSEILNLQSEFSLDELELVRQRPVRVGLTEPPSEEELERAILWYGWWRVWNSSRNDAMRRHLCHPC